MLVHSYSRASTLDAALSEHIANVPLAVEYIAGGTELIPLLKNGQRSASHLIDINALPWREIAEQRSCLRIGSLARLQDVANHPIVRRAYPVISQALLASGSVQIRNMASIGGNLLQSTRCGYFRDSGFPCNKRRPGSGCPARDGENRTHAIFGVSDHCVASHASDLAVALVALDAELELCGPDGRRSVPIGEFYRVPGDTPDRETVLNQGELVEAISVPKGPHTSRSDYLKLRDRASFEFSLMSVAVAAHVEDGVIRALRIAMGGVGTVPWRLPAVEQALQNAPANPKSYRFAAAEAARGARPLHHNAFKVGLMQRMLVRALETVVTQEPRE
jgi:xanthine dehydrogenase YagS FAD-binding subunit